MSGIASTVSSNKIIDVERFVVNPCFNSKYRRLIINFEMMISSHEFRSFSKGKDKIFLVKGSII